MPTVTEEQIHRLRTDESYALAVLESITRREARIAALEGRVAALTGALALAALSAHWQCGEPRDGFPVESVGMDDLERCSNTFCQRMVAALHPTPARGAGGRDGER